MKIFLKVLLVIMLVASSMSISMKGHRLVEASTGDYYNLLMGEIKSIGIMKKDNLESYGVVYAKVADFDNNGSDELYMVKRSAMDGDYEENLYEGNQLVYENLIPSVTHRSSYSLRIGEGEKGVYLSYPSQGGSGGSGVGVTYDQYQSDAYFRLGDSRVGKVFEKSVWEYGYDMELLAMLIEEGEMVEEEGYKVYENWDGVSPEQTRVAYYIDENEVNQATYDSKSKPYENIDWIEIISGGSFDMNAPVVDSEQVVHQVIQELEAFSKPKNLGEDVKESMEQDVKTSLVDWLMYSQYFQDGYKVGDEMSDQELFEYLFMPNGGAQAVQLEYNDTGASSEFPKNTYSRMESQAVDSFLSMYLGQSLKEEDFVLGDEEFPFIKQGGYYYFPDFAMGWLSYAVPYIRGVYEIAQDVYYVEFTEYQLIQEEFAELSADEVHGTPPSQVYELITEEERSGLSIEDRGYAVMKKSLINGEYQWTLIERNTKGGTFDESLIEKYKKRKLAPAQINLTFNHSSDDSTVDDYVNTIEKEISEKELNEQDMSLLTQYIIVALQKINMQSIEASKNALLLTNEQLKSNISNMQSSKQQFVEGLELGKLSLPKRLELIHRINVDRLDLEKPIKVQLSPELLDGIDIESQREDLLYISFDGRSLGAAIKFEQLQSILQEYGHITLTFMYSDSQVEVAFANNDGPIEKLTSPIQIIMPANSDTSMVYMDQELWGGQFIQETNSLVFETKGSGKYTTKENKWDLTDIDKLTEEQQQAINYLVTRGFFDVENNQFEVSKTISRNDFAKTLVRLFFSLDKDAQTTFTDVKEDSPYYQFIASGQQNEIIYGYEDHTFKGDNLISIAHVLSLSGRTLANKKGYAYPADPAEYLDFLDADSLNDQAKGEIALTVREGLIDQGGLLEPQRQITRLEAAEILYRLYMLLYEQPLYTIEAEVEGAVPLYQEYKWPLLGGGAAILALTGIFIIMRLRRKSGASVGQF